jgi:hypothetical protein
MRASFVPDIFRFGLTSLIMVLIGAVMLRLAVWLFNRFVGRRTVESSGAFDPVAEPPLEDLPIASDNPYQAPLVESMGIDRQSGNVVPTPSLLRAAAIVFLGVLAQAPLNLILPAFVVMTAPDAFYFWLASTPVAFLIYSGIAHWLLPTARFRHAMGVVLLLYAISITLAVAVAALFLVLWYASAGI